MRTMTVSIVGAMMAGMACLAQAGTADHTEWSDVRAAGFSDTAHAAPCGTAHAVAAKNEPGAQPAHLYDTLENLVNSGQVLYLRHTLTGADQWLAQPTEKACEPGGTARRDSSGKCAS